MTNITDIEMSRRAQRRMIVGFVIAALIASIVSFEIYRIVRQSVEAEGWTAHTGIVLSELTKLSVLFTEADISARYIAMDSGTDAEDVKVKRALVFEQIKRLKELTSDNSIQQENLALTEAFITRHFQFMDGMMKAKSEGGIERAMDYWSGEKGIELLAGVELSIKRTETEETLLLHERIQRAQRGIQWTITAIVALTLFSFALVGFIFYLTILHLRFTKKVSDGLRETIENLKKKSASHDRGEHERAERQAMDGLKETQAMLEHLMHSVSGEHVMT